MQIKTVGMSAASALILALAANSASTNNNPVDQAVAKGAQWIASVQGRDGGWGQDGGETSYVRQNEHLETNGNDVANTAVAVLALRRSGNQYQANIERGLNYIMQNVENSPGDGLLITNHNGTQIQRKLGPYIDTFLTSMLLSEVDGNMPTAAQNARVRHALEKCVAKIQSNQQRDGSWNVGGGWAPILGTSMASRSLYEAQQKGVKVEARAMDAAVNYTKEAAKSTAAPASAGVPLYQSAQALEQLSRTKKDRDANAPQIAAIRAQLTDEKFVNGFGSVGGEEFFSYLNVSDGLRRTGGDEWNKWRTNITARILKLQNQDGTWSGSHCITGRVAVTSAAILNLTVK
jgi:Squalene-hopene cyclase C-terminal domain/Prenyltransferase and squalene oxidase repeat